ncbi:MAG: undecaprenyl-diphosphatase [Clostridiales bacterium]|jgi:undecaprenyl-diphosphatase|nr:undecaprenyl-diphosphatase [Clostridiales bacterium]MDN5281161.1 undecaprenyl-diphosphatase [Candidatus Ozemobacter sp.]
MLNTALQGVIQGLTEFLPVSSSGHLTLFQFFTGRTNLEANMQTDIAVHFGTLIAVIFYFRNDLMPFFTLSGWKNAETRRIAMLVIAASIPTAALGIGFKKQFEALFASPASVCLFLFLTGILLLVSEKLKQKTSTHQNIAELSYARAATIGFVQGLAITPGISRSGSTIGAGLIAGLDGEAAAKFSFFLMIPAVSGATLLEAKKLLESTAAPATSSTELVIGATVAAITGFAALKLLVYMIKKQKLSIFAYYLFIVSISSFIAINFLGK